MELGKRVMAVTVVEAWPLLSDAIIEHGSDYIGAGDAGDWLVKYPGGYEHIVDARTFDRAFRTRGPHASIWELSNEP